MRDRAFRRFKTYVKGMRRIKEDRQEHGTPFGNTPLEKTCACFAPRHSSEFGKIFSRFANYPKNCGGKCCANPRKLEGMTIQEKRAIKL